jgi:hypothetical protein
VNSNSRERKTFITVFMREPDTFIAKITCEKETFITKYEKQRRQP